MLNEASKFKRKDIELTEEEKLNNNYENQKFIFRKYKNIINIDLGSSIRKIEQTIESDFDYK